MRKPRRESLPILALLFGGLALWGTKQLAKQYVDEADARAFARPPLEDSAFPDTALPRARAHNAEFAGLAPGFSAGAGETEDFITPLSMVDRIMVKKKRGRKGAPPAAQAGNPWKPDVYPMAHLFGAPGRKITPLDVRDPAALVMPPSDSH